MAFSELVRATLDEGHGGAILIVPDTNSALQETLNPFPYQLEKPDTGVREFIRGEIEETQRQGAVLSELEASGLSPELKARIYSTAPRSNHWIPLDAIRSMASLLAVDGALVVTRDLTLLGFGAKIAFDKDTEVPICTFPPTAGRHEVVMRRLEDLGGMRHQSAARFAFANKDAFAIVVSQDRHVSLMYWESELDAVSVVRNAEWWV